MHDLSVAFVWHQHQPYYSDDVAGYNPMPWVRLHGTKDYWGLAQHLAEVPEVHATINLVPSLLAQILAYTEHGATDEHLRVSRIPADGLSEADAQYLLDAFFMANPDQMIRPYPRYRELYEQRGLHVDGAERALRRFQTRDLLDLQCWNNLVWFHPIAFEVYDDLAEFRDKGGHWTEAEKQWLLDKQMEVLSEVVPLHRKLADRGQVELTTTPFYHPILPLLIDKQLARQAMPGVNLPRRLEGYAEDAAEQIRRGVAYHEKLFGSKPLGMWPSEGSVAQAIIPLVAEAGIEWIATDEEILAGSTDGWVSRDPHGMVRNPEMLYAPWRVEEQGKSVQMIFRDHALSDQIGFHFQRYHADDAVRDLLGTLEAIDHATEAHATKRPALVSIILDGENCWEYYPNQGVDFLRSLYHGIARHPRIHGVRVRDYLAEHPATERVGHLFAGSWISHNFGIWIGHPSCNKAWDLVSEAREALVEREASGEVTPAKLSQAWDELFIAEGSDWFWWFDDRHSSAQDWLFDELFRKHLQNVYTLIGLEAPVELQRPVGGDRRHVPPFTQPSALLDVKVNGRETYFEWLGAGGYSASTGRGTMNMADAQRIERVYFGFDQERLLLRFDATGPISDRLVDVETLRIAFLQPAGFELLITEPAQARPSVRLFHNDVPVSAPGVEAAADAILEVAVPWRSLATAPEAPLNFFAELYQLERSIERIPQEGLLETVVPSPDFELMMWQA
ncbi:MAG: alpha-amylase/alpha-mannosidase [Planctomycetota bacterium]|nr:MAG: alpha-amylase/alpha-mannosidase [Planctomycetota bacterium]